MTDPATLQGFLGWCTVINSSLLLLATVALATMNDWIRGIHSRVLHVDAGQLGPLYFQYLAHYKLLIIVFNLVPWLALLLIR